MGEHQRVVGRSRSLIAPGNEQGVTKIISGRSRQVIRLHGYSMTFHFGFDEPLDEDTGNVFLALQTSQRNWGILPNNHMGQGTLSQEGLLKQQLVDFLYASVGIQVITSGAVTPSTTHRTTGWVPCNLLVPELAMYHSFEAIDTVGLSRWVVAEYEWEDADLAKLAAVNLVWGRDPGDFDRA